MKQSLRVTDVLVGITIVLGVAFYVNANAPEPVGQVDSCCIDVRALVGHVEGAIELLPVDHPARTELEDGLQLIGAKK